MVWIIADIVWVGLVWPVNLWMHGLDWVWIGLQTIPRFTCNLDSSPRVGQGLTGKKNPDVPCRRGSPVYNELEVPLSVRLRDFCRDVPAFGSRRGEQFGTRIGDSLFISL